MPQSANAEFDIFRRSASRCFWYTKMLRHISTVQLYASHASRRCILMVLVSFEVIEHHLMKTFSLLVYVLHFNLFLRYIQNSFIQASYWHDPLQETEYQRKNLFLADINNENINNTVSAIMQ